MGATEPSVQNIWLEDELRCCSSYSGHLNDIEVIVNIENGEISCKYSNFYLFFFLGEKKKSAALE